MLNIIKRLLKDLVTKEIHELIKYLLIILITSVSGFLYNQFVLNGEHLAAISVITTIICIITLCILGLIIYQETNPIFNIYKKNDFKFIFLEKSLTYDYTDLECIKYEKKVKLKVICDNVDRFYDKYSWSGEEKPRITSSDSSHQIVETPKRDSYETFEVHFGKSYKKGEIIELNLLFEMKDTEQKSDTRISTTIDEPIRNLHIKIVVSEAYREGSAVAVILPVIDPSHWIYREDKKFDNNGVVQWDVKDPKMLTKYSLTWNQRK